MQNGITIIKMVIFGLSEIIAMVSKQVYGILIIKMDKNGPKEFLKIMKKVEYRYYMMKTEQYIEKK